jgi:cytochrome c5
MTCQKTPYPNQALALHALEAVRSIGKPGKQPVLAFPCQKCHSWHLTSKNLTGKTPRWDRELSWTGG